MIVSVDTLNDVHEILGRILEEYITDDEKVTRSSFESVMSSIVELTKKRTGRIKKCRKCLRIYLNSEEDFDVNLNTRDGLRHECKSCRNQYQNKFKKLRRVENNLSPEYISEVNRIRAVEGKLPLSFPKRRAPKKKKTGSLSYQEALDIQNDGLGGQKHD